MLAQRAYALKTVIRLHGPDRRARKYLGAVYFDGDPGELLPAYQRMLEKFGLEALDVHLCITTDAGLPVPRVSGLGNIQVAHVRQAIHP